jgi:hypothetical protein
MGVMMMGCRFNIGEFAAVFLSHTCKPNLDNFAEIDGRCQKRCDWYEVRGVNSCAAHWEKKPYLVPFCVSIFEATTRGWPVHGTDADGIKWAQAPEEFWDTTNTLIDWEKVAATSSTGSPSASHGVRNRMCFWM